MSLELFHPLIERWFRARLGEPTEPQRLGWPSIAAGRHTLIAAPTGSGKTLAAFLVCIDRLLGEWLNGTLTEQTQVVYVSPLKALSNDIHRNLETPLAEIGQLAAEHGYGLPPIRTAVRTGDTPASQRQAMLRRPPHILVTTPESLYLLLTSAKSRELLRSTKTVIVDEIHALARDKRGSHLALSLERLAALCETFPTRIGLSATQRPIDAIGRFLVGTRDDASAGNGATGNGLLFDHAAKPDCTIVDVGHIRALDLAVEVPPSELSAVCSHEQWDEVYSQIARLINEHRSTLVFVNTRRLAERVAHRLSETLGPDAVASHHGSLARQVRQSAEARLKAGSLKAIVATASLEMGIDIGYIDLVCQIGSPRSIATLLQRVGRSGHALGKVPKGRLFPLTRDELVECLALTCCVRRGELDRIEIPQKPLDILAQQIVAAVACDEWSEDELFALCRRAWAYRNLSRIEFDEVVQMLSQGIGRSTRRGAHLHRDAIGRRLRPRRGARIAALTSGGAIPETAQFRVVTDPDGVCVGTLDEDFAIESLAGDVFLLGNTSWRILYVRGGEVVVRDAAGAPPSIPFWLGEAPGRTVELSAEVSSLRDEIARRVAGVKVERENGEPSDSMTAVVAWLAEAAGASLWAAEQAVQYIAAQVVAIGLAPTNKNIVFERFFDESGGMQLVIHSPLGARINRAWGLALRKRFCRSFDFELQASADDEGIVLSIGPQHSFPIDDLFRMIGPHNAQTLLEQALIAAPMFPTRWRWNVTRALAVPRWQSGQKVPPFLQRFRSDDLLAAVFPAHAGCLENHSGDLPIPDHPLVRQTMSDCLHEAMDVDGWVALLKDAQEGRVRLVARDTREPSPFAEQRLNAQPYSFLDDAPLEERRTRAVTIRRGRGAAPEGNLGQLDPEAIEQVSREAWPLVRSADELHDALMNLVVLLEGEAGGWGGWFDELIAAGRAARVRRANRPTFWIAAEKWPVVRAAYEGAHCDPILSLPEELDRIVDGCDAWVELVRGRIQHGGPTTAVELADLLDLEVARVQAALEALEGSGMILRGRFTDRASVIDEGAGKDIAEWCDRRLLARIHRLTLDGLRRRIQPAEPHDFLRFLARHHGLLPGRQGAGLSGVREALARLQGFETSAAVWEPRLLASRVADYDPRWLDHLFLSGEAMWGRLRPPRRDENDGPSLSAMTRTVPISVMRRGDLGWSLPADRAAADEFTRPAARQVLELLLARGALFPQQLVEAVQLLPGHLDEALRELAALGLVTSDSFGAVRAIVEGASRRHAPRRRRARPASATSPAGRWSPFPGHINAPPRDECLEKWCRQLLSRYGIVFRDLMTRESAAPGWGELAPVMRRMERQGEIRGGRFVTGVAGEQFATTHAVERLREIRDEPPDEPWIVISAADPLNLIGVLSDGSRIPALHTGALILQAGHWKAARHAGRVAMFAEVEPMVQSEMIRALQLGRRKTTEAAQVRG